MERPKIIAIDVDKTLTKKTAWSVEDCLNAIPRLDVIEKVNKLADKNFIIIYTARKDYLTEATIKWLHKYNVKFEAYSNKKIPVDIYLDDKALNVEDFMKE